MILLLLANGADPNVICKDASPLWLACFHGLIEVIHPLLDNGADPNCVCKGTTPLHVATVRGLVEVVEILCSFERGGADVNLSTERLGTAMHVAVNHGHKHVLSVLLKYQPDLTRVNRNGETILHLAACAHDLSMAYQILACDSPTLNPFIQDSLTGATVAHVTTSPKLFRDLLRRWPELLHATDNFGCTPTFYMTNDALGLFQSITSKSLQYFGKDLLNEITRYADVELKCPTIATKDKGAAGTETTNQASLEESLSEVSIEIPHVHIPCHKAMLYARVPYFRERLEPKPFQPMDNASNIEMEVLPMPTISAAVMSIIVRYIYTDSLSSEPALLNAVVAAATELGLKRLADLAKGKLGKSVEPPDSVFAKDMSFLRTSGAFADINVVAPSSVQTATGKERSLFLHRFILAEQSEFFKALFTSGMRESQTGIAELPSMRLQALDALITWFYSNEWTNYTNTVKGCFELLELAHTLLNTTISLPLQTRILSILINSEWSGFDLAITQAYRLHAQIIAEQCAVAYTQKSVIRVASRLTGDVLTYLKEMIAPRDDPRLRR